MVGYPRCVAGLPGSFGNGVQFIGSPGRIVNAFAKRPACLPRRCPIVSVEPYCRRYYPGRQVGEIGRWSSYLYGPFTEPGQQPATASAQPKTTNNVLVRPKR